MGLQNNSLGITPSFSAVTTAAGAGSSVTQNTVLTSAVSAVTTVTLTITNPLIVVGSVLSVTAYNGVTTGVQVTSLTITNGQVVIVLNFASFTGNIITHLGILN